MKTLISPSQHRSAPRRWASSAVLLSFVLIANHPVNARGYDPEATTEIAGTSAHLEDLVVTIAWPGSATERWLEIAVFDDDDLQIAAQLVWPTPGQRTQTTFANLLPRLPENGLQFFATIRDSAGQEVSERHAFRGVLQCPRLTEPCHWTTQDGLYTDALAISAPLRTALDALEAEPSNDLLTDALERHPELRGPVFSLAAQLDQLDQRLDLGVDCFCAWFHSSTDSPERVQCQYKGPGKLPDETGSEQLVLLGKGATATVAAQALASPVAPFPTATGSSEQTLEIRCWEIHRWIESTNLPLVPSPGTPPQTVRFPVTEACPDSCLGAVESSATLGYQLTTGARQHPSKSSFAGAYVEAILRRHDTAQPPEETSWQAGLQWTPGDLFASASGGIRIPTQGVLLNSDTRGVTTTLSGTATVDVKADADEAWSYGMANFTGTLLQAKGHADCALQPTREAELTSAGGVRTEDCGEPQIEPWDD